MLIPELHLRPTESLLLVLGASTCNEHPGMTYWSRDQALPTRAHILQGSPEDTGNNTRTSYFDIFYLIKTFYFNISYNAHNVLQQQYMSMFFLIKIYIRAQTHFLKRVECKAKQNKTSKNLDTLFQEIHFSVRSDWGAKYNNCINHCLFCYILCCILCGPFRSCNLLKSSETL